MKEMIQIMIVCYIQYISAQLSSVEEIRNTSSCTVSSFTIDCGTSSIAVDSITLNYHASCETTCCTYDSTHCSENLDASDRNYVRRQCSGRSSCTLGFSGVQQFCSLGIYEPSYVVIYYYCIPSARQLSICSSSSLQSSGSPLYITSNRYPSVAIVDSTCSCSLEVYDCSSSVNLYIIDADLYSDTSTCVQSLEIKDSSNALLHEIKCESYYVSDITSQTLNKHYISINFLDNSDLNLEGVFFLAFSASAETSKFSLNCSATSKSRCVDCGSTFNISNGVASLAVKNDSFNGASANVVCDDGYETTKGTIICTDMGSWETSTCTEDANGGVSEENTGARADASKEGGGGLKTGVIAGIVFAIVVPVIVVIAILVYCKYKHSQPKVSPSDYEKNEVLDKPSSGEKESPRTSVATNSIPRRKLPPITPKDKIKHGPVYIDHDEANTLALTIHMPFRKQANRLDPL